MSRRVDNKHKMTFVNVTSIGVYNKPIVINFLPESLVDDYSSQWGSETPLGRSNPIYIYAGGGDRSFSFSFDLHEDMIPDDTRFKTDVVTESRVEVVDGVEVVVPGGTKSLPDIRKFAAHMQALSYPVRQGGVIKPPRVYMRLGDVFAGFGRIDTTISWSNQRGGRYAYASFKISFVSEVALPLFVQDIVNNLHNDVPFRVFL